MTARSIQIARALVDEVGTQAETARVVGVKQPSISGWLKNGIGKTRENDLRFRFPKLKVWKECPPLKET